MDTDIQVLLKKPVSCIKGIGETREKLFQNLGIFTVEDLITHFPREHEDRSSLKSIAELVDGESCSFEGAIASKVAETRIRQGLSLYKVRIRDHTGFITATWFNQRYIKNVLRIDERYIFYGKITRKRSIFEVQNPVYESAYSSQMKSTCRIVPVYPSTANLTQNTLRAAIECSLDLVTGKLDDILPQWVRQNYNLSEFNYSIRNIHFPKSEADFNNARYRLAFEELFLLQLGLMSIKKTIQQVKEGIRFAKTNEISGFINSLPFQLTNAQKKVFAEIEQDMESPKVMSRLVQGDVGSGKTVVAVLALFKACKSGYQGCMLVPTEILAEQHYRTLTALFEGFGINVGLLTGSQSKKVKQQTLDGISEGNINIVVGTHALLEENVSFKQLGLVVTDEQHRFGVRQRTAMSLKGENPDVLVMTATPIPRTLALILYGDLDISVIDQLPPGRKPIETYSVDNSKRQRINTFIHKKVEEGRQVYIVCPLVDESDSIQAKSALKTAEKIAGEDFKDLKVGLIHGKMKPRDKEDTMKRFINGEINILVSTTVIEVGVNVPNATIMVVENAERFGLAQLHQLRGRVGRGVHQSYCILYNESSSGVSGERMKVMQKTNDGFVISEKDLELRGPGEFFGTRQHGIPDLKIANLYSDMDILKKAQEAALKLLEQDSMLEATENLMLREKLVEKFKRVMADIAFN